MIRAILIAVVLAPCVIACGDKASSGGGNVSEYVGWARVRTEEISTLLDEMQEHAQDANRNPLLQSNPVWHERAQVLLNGVITSAGLIRERQTVPTDATEVHAQLLELAIAGETMASNASIAISSQDPATLPTAIEAKNSFDRLEPLVHKALADLEAAANVVE